MYIEINIHKIELRGSMLKDLLKELCDVGRAEIKLVVLY